MYIVPRVGFPNIKSCTRNEPYSNTNPNRNWLNAWNTRESSYQTPLHRFLCEIMYFMIDDDIDIYFDLHEGDISAWIASGGCANYLNNRHPASAYWLADAVDRYNEIGRDVYLSEYIFGWYPAKLQTRVDPLM